MSFTTTVTGQHDRFKDAPWYKPQDISILGVGGIGSWTALLLSRMGHNIFIYDDDRIEASNLGGQLYKIQDVGRAKTESIAQTVTEYSGDVTIIDMGRYEKGSGLSNITILAFDNMKYRKEAAEEWFENQIDKKRNNTSVEGEVNILIDGRMEAETAIIYAVDRPSRYNKWMEEWFPDERVPDAPCSFRATSHNGAMIASMITSILNNKIANVTAKNNHRDVPYKLDYGLHLLDFTTHL